MPIRFNTPAGERVNTVLTTMVLCEGCNGASDDILACKPKLETYFWDIGKGHY